LKPIRGAGIDIIDVAKVETKLLTSSQRTNRNLKCKGIGVTLIISYRIRLNCRACCSLGRGTGAVLNYQVHILKSFSNLNAIPKFPHPITKRRPDKRRGNIAK
jgi:hypothetical protein